MEDAYENESPDNQQNFPNITPDMIERYIPQNEEHLM